MTIARYLAVAAAKELRAGKALLALAVAGVALGVGSVLSIQLLNQGALGAFAGTAVVPDPSSPADEDRYPAASSAAPSRAIPGKGPGARSATLTRRTSAKALCSRSRKSLRDSSAFATSRSPRPSSSSV